MAKLIEKPFDTIPEGFYYYSPRNSTGEDNLAEIRTIGGDQIGFVKWYNMPAELQERYKRDIESFDRMHKRINDGNVVRRKMPDGSYVYGHSCDCSVDESRAPQIEPTTRYHQHTQKPGEEQWHYDALTYHPEHAFDEETLAYMSHVNRRYRVVTETDGAVIGDVVYEPNDVLRAKYKDYFLCPQVPK